MLAGVETADHYQTNTYFEVRWPCTKPRAILKLT